MNDDIKAPTPIELLERIMGDAAFTGFGDDLQAAIYAAVDATNEDALPITPEWLEASGSIREDGSVWYWFHEDSSTICLSPMNEHGAWCVCINGRLADWSATNRGQIDRLRKALNGEG